MSDLEVLAADDARYKLESYIFVINAVEFTMRSLRRRGHVSGRELLEGIKGLAKREFGPMAKTVFESWGVAKTEDFGEIVFKLIGAGILGKTDKDSREDFTNVFDFNDVFEKQYDWNIEGAL
ncbi:MAG: Minf_1886 family protein [Candidatus Eisenbacteria bacterium]